jgi:hypothetical protein
MILAMVSQFAGGLKRVRQLPLAMLFWLSQLFRWEKEYVP